MTFQFFHRLRLLMFKNIVESNFMFCLKQLPATLLWEAEQTFIGRTYKIAIKN